MSTILCPSCHRPRPQVALDCASPSYCECPLPSWMDIDSQRILFKLYDWLKAKQLTETPKVTKWDIDLFLAEEFTARVRRGS